MQKVFRLAFAHLWELRNIICVLDSQIPIVFTGVGISTVVQAMRARDRRQEAALEATSILCRLNEIHLEKVLY